MKLKTIVTFLYLCVSLLAFVSFNTNASVWISFFLSFSVITIIAYYHLNIETVFSPFLGSYVIFNYLFFFIAPVFQISSLSLANSRFPNDFIFNPSTVIKANILIIIFNITFFLSYIYFKKKRRVNSLLVDEKFVFYKHSTIAILAILLLCTLVIYFNYEYVITNILESIYTTNAKSESVSSLLLRKKFLFFLPLAGVVATISYLKEKNKLSTNTIVIFICLLLFIVMLLFLKNIFTEKRNTLGPIYIALIYLFYPKLLDSNSKFFLFLFFSMVIMFPLMSSLTHIDANLDQIIKKPQLLYESFLRFGTISGAFESLHYDAFSNILATLEYVEINGIALGYQLLGVILFFIPRKENLILNT
jgi:magnesium-transporting ATPase (P-type)